MRTLFLLTLICAAIVVIYSLTSGGISDRQAERAQAQAAIEQARAVQAQAQAQATIEQARAHEEGATQRAQAYALAITAIVTAATANNNLIGIGVILLDVALILWALRSRARSDDGTGNLDE